MSSSPPARTSSYAPQPSPRSSTPKSAAAAHPRVATLSSQPTRSMSAQAALSNGTRISPTTRSSHDGDLFSIDKSAQLSRAAPGVVKTRLGSVLARGCILKTDYHKALESLDVSLHGAPNFRASKHSALNVFGTAQPRLVGVKAILSILRCRPDSPNPSRCIWFSTREEPVVYISGRPFVLRDASEPRKTIELSDRSETLEAIEVRLKNDVLAEAARFGGLILTHNENAEGDGTIVPMWTAVEESTLRTPREVWEDLRKQGWLVDYHRIPISTSRRIEDNYLDSYVRVIQDLDPLATSLVFSCGAGAVRTTYAMSAATLLRRKQLIALGLDDPFAALSHLPRSGTSTPTSVQAAVPLEQFTAQQDFSRSLLRLAAILQQTLSTTYATQSAIELLLSQPVLMDNLRKALLGNYSVVLSLLGCIDDGLQTKRLVDDIFDSCDQVVNLREIILSHRVKYSLVAADDKDGEDILDRASGALEKYFFMIAFASYVAQTDFNETFADWLKTRVEIWNQILFLRKSSGSRLNVFAPVNDLSSISKTGAEYQIWGPRNSNLSGLSMGDEWTAHVLNNRSGIVLRANTLLKSDRWLSQSHETPLNIRGVINFRNIPESKIYCLGQPTLEAIDEVVRCIKERHPEARRIAWITLREEPLVYINGSPYCLRRENFTLRNMKDYGGISGSRLEVLEERLKSDVLAELQSFDGRVLVHTERAQGEVVPVWETVKPTDVAVLKDVMESKRIRHDVELQFSRIPITAERAPDPTDISELLELVMRLDADNTPIVLNCQLGRGRSTMASIIVLLAQQWLQSGRQPATPGRPHPMLRHQTAYPFTELTIPQQRSYQSINNLLRVVRNGLLVKSTVDVAIDACSGIYNLREAIEDARVRSEEASDEIARRAQQHRGIHNLRRYFQLIEFQAYLQATQPGVLKDHETFETFLKNHPVFQTFEDEMLAAGPAALKSLERVMLADGVAFPDEENQLVANRSGSILSASTILKSDFFSGLQKMSLPERIDGAPNFRRADLTFSVIVDDHHKVCGCGMPTVQGLRRALARVDAGPNGRNTVYWTSLREEPVLYVGGRPHVLRLIDRPLVNVEQKGVTTAMVETMENNLKRDLVHELHAGNGRVLVHDEVEDPPGNYTITAIWETLKEDDIMTPRDVFELMKSEGYRVNYGRVAITDEQAPLPAALGEIFDRVNAGLKEAGDLVFNCQMGRGRTTTGMVVASLVSTVSRLPATWDVAEPEENEAEADPYDLIDGFSEEQAYLQGEYKTILQLVGVLSQGKLAKRLTDKAIDAMQDVQNLRKAIYDYKLKVDASAPGTAKFKSATEVGNNYLYRYGTIIAFANYLLERDGRGFAEWLAEHREIGRVLERSRLIE